MGKRELISHALYKHFKGKIYLVEGISYPLQDHIVEVIPPLRPYEKYKHTEKNIYLIIRLQRKNRYVHPISKEERPLVVYKRVKDGNRYVRPLEMFLSEVDKDKYPDVKQKYRFEFLNII